MMQAMSVHLDYHLLLPAPSDDAASGPINFQSTSQSELAGQWSLDVSGS